MEVNYIELFLVNNSTVEKRGHFFLFFVLLIAPLLCHSLKLACYSAVLLKIKPLENIPWTSRDVCKPPLDGKAALALLTLRLRGNPASKTCCNLFPTLTESPSIQILKRGWPSQYETKLFGVRYLWQVYTISFMLKP